MSLFNYSLLCVLLLLAGGILAWILGEKVRKVILQDILSFTGSFLFGLLILEFFPTIFHEHNHFIGLAVLMGFFLQIGMDIWTRGIEHGHVHIHPDQARKRSWLISLFLGLGLHAIMDGLPFLGLSNVLPGHDHSQNIYTGILLHKLAEGFTIFLVLQLLAFNLTKSFLYLFIFALITPLSMWAINKFPFLVAHGHYVLAFAGGSLLHVAITILFESENVHHHGIAWRKLSWILAGIGLAAGIVFG